MSSTVTDLRQRLNQSERRIENIVSAVPGILYVALADYDNYRCVYVSPQIEVDLGFTVEEWLVDPELWAKQLHDEDRNWLLDRIKLLIATRDVFEYEYRIWTKGKRSLRWFYDRVRVERSHDGTPLELVGLMTDISERKETSARIERYQTKIRNAQSQTILALGQMAHKRDPYTHGHQERVSELAVAIGTEMGLTADQLEGLKLGAHIHDIGKVYIPAEILNRPGKLSAPEFDLIKTHPMAGFEIVSTINFPWPIKEIILQHHERMDGSGYPQGLKGEEICLEARIIAIADTIDAMSSHRPYRPALGVKRALEAIEDGTGRLYDPEAVRACLSLFSAGHLPIADGSATAEAEAPHLSHA